MAKEERHKKRNNDKKRRHVPEAEGARRDREQCRNQNIRDAFLNYAQRLLSLLTIKGTRNFGSTSPSIVLNSEKLF